MKTELISKLEELLTKEAGEVAHDVRKLQKEFQKEWSIEFENAKQQFVDEGGKLKEFDYPKQPEDIKFESLLDKFKKLKKESDEKLAKDQEKNLTLRLEIISKITDLTKLSDNVSAAFKKLQELQNDWKNCGAVSSHKYKDIQADYSKAVEAFYYNLKIYKDLQEHDLKRNFELKTDIIEKINALQESSNAKEAEHAIKTLRNEWEEIGPVPNEKWLELKSAYKSALDNTYAKIKAYYKGIEEKKGVNLQDKLILIEKLKEHTANLNLKTISAWNNKTEEIIKIQTDWKNVGRTTEKDNDKVWTEFRTLCDLFFDAKKEFYASLKEKFAENRKLKASLIEKAELLQASTDWQKTTLQLVKLQEEWKKHPSHGDKEETKLFTKFRKACNAFFEAKKAHFDSLDAALEVNLKVKEEVLEKLNSFTLTTDLQQNRNALKEFAVSWNKAGLVPFKDKKRLNEAFYNKLDEFYGQLDIDKQEKASIQYQSKIDRLLATENPTEHLTKEADFLKKQMDEVTSVILKYENNLGFFKHTKGDNPLLKDVQDKITAEKLKLEEFKLKRKQITTELAKLRQVPTE